MSQEDKSEKYSEKNVQYSEQGYKQLQLISILFAGVAVTTLLDNVPIKNTGHKINYTTHIALLMMFIVCCIHIMISGVIAMHMFSTYKILSQKGNTAEKAIKASKPLRKIVPYLMYAFWISLPIFIVSTSILTIIRYKVNHHTSIFIMYFIVTGIFLFCYFVYINLHINVRKKYLGSLKKVKT